MTAPLNELNATKNSYFSYEDNLLLDVGYQNKFSLKLSKTDLFTCCTLEVLISEAKENQRDYIFVLAEDNSQKIFFFDGKSFCKWIASSSLLKNPLTNELLINVRFYIIPKNLTLEDIKKGSSSFYLCSLEEYLDFEKNSFFYHLIDRSYIENESKDLVNYNLVLDFFFDRGINRNDALAFKYAETFAKMNNKYCSLLSAFLYNKGIGISKPDPMEGGIYYRRAEFLFENIELTSIYYQTLETKFEQRKDPKRSTLAEEYRSQTLHSFIL